MEMSAALQVSLFLASLAFIGLVACIIPMAFQARSQFKQLVLTVEQLKPNLVLLVPDSREMVRNVSELSKRASQQMDEVGRVVHTARQWTDRGDRIVNAVGSAIEPPVFSLVRKLSVLRTGTTTFLQALFHPNQNNNQARREKNHV